MAEIKMPQLGETVVEGTITKWLKKEGDQVEADELLVEVSTDKVDSEVPSSESGTLTKILVAEGETVKVGTPLAIIGDEGAAGGDDGADETAAETADEGDSQPQAKESASSNGSAGSDAETQRQEPEQPAAGPPDSSQEEPKKEEPEQPAARSDGSDQHPSRQPATAGAAARGAPGDQSKRGIISPLVRRLADEHGVDLNEVEGSGTGGRIRKQDVLRFVEERKARPAARPAASAEPAPQPEAERAPQEAAPAAAAVGGREELVPWTNIRRRTAEHMVAAHLETARAWNAVEADWSGIAELRARAKDNFKAREGFSLTFMPFLSKAICETLLEMPEVNASFDEENEANLVRHYVNLGIAVALEGGGLIVPVIKGADEKNLVGLARAVNDVATRARTKKLSPDDLVGGTFTITNPGPFGSIISVPIIPRGQTAILGFEAIQKRVVVTDEDAIAIRSMGFLSMSWDHRTIDGAEAARFLATLREKLETTDFSSELSAYL
ncbi:MAG TPA: dihydrolipoamide acetyltransferase family protein [Actinomycetota bacterium]|nr:dihydrolipoamide acetyltransferase family protein [Actinomycetota bacterium]